MSTQHPRLSIRASRAAALALSVYMGVATAATAASPDDKVTFDIPAQSLESALLRFSRQAGVQLLTSSDEIPAAQSNGVSGLLTVRAALAALLEGTGLTFTVVGDGTIAIRPARAQTSDGAETSEAAKSLRLAQATSNGPEGARDEQERIELEEIVVTGTLIRAEAFDEGPSPVLRYTREDIERSGRTSLPDFLKLLPQNFAAATIAGADTASLTPNPGGASAPSLRGLGAASTLTLLNGRRLPAAAASLGFLSDISVIPVAAIERVEILPDSASAIYGSDAVAGVVNIILRKDFRGLELNASYGATTDSGYDRWQASAVAGTGWASGSLLIGVDSSTEDMLASAERDFSRTDDLRSRGGSDRRSTFGHPGNILGFSGGSPPGITTPVAIPSGQDGRDLTAADLQAQVGQPLNRIDGAATVSTLLPRQERTAVFLSARQDLASWLSFYVDGYWARRETTQNAAYTSSTFVVPATNAFNRFGSTAQVAYSLVELGPSVITQDIPTYSAAGTFEARFGEWRAEASYSLAADSTETLRTNEIDTSTLAAALASSDPAVALNVFGDGSANSSAVLDSISMNRPATRNTRLDATRVTFDGPVAMLPGGELKAAVGAEYRHERYDFDATGSGSLRPHTVGEADRIAKAGFAEVRLPIYGERNARPGLQRLELALAGRAEDYDDFGRANTPKFGLTWKPVDALLLRGSYSKAFQSPSIESGRQAELALISQSGGTFPDPARNGELVPLQLLLGGGKTLRPQKADSWTAGFVVQPWEDSALRLAADYFSIDYVDRVASYDTSEIARDPITFADFQTRAPLTPADQAAGFEYGRLLQIDLRQTNAAQTRVSGWDFQGEYRFPATVIGGFSTQVNLTYYDSYRNKPTATGPTFERRGVLGYPTRYAGSIGLSWERGPFSVNTLVRHSDDYRDTNFRTDDAVIDAYTTCDVALGYRSSAHNTWLSGFMASLSVINAFGEDPPFVNRSGAYDVNVADARGRTVILSLRKSY